MLVLGPSGSGKSTLTLCLDGLIPHLVEGDYAGEVTVAGLVVADTPVHVLAQETGLVFQDPDAQFCTLTVEDEIAFGLENLCRAPADIDAAIDMSLAAVGLEGYRSRELTSLSGGEKQRVAIASVMAMGPRVLVLDEPSANLDPHATSELFGLLRRLAVDGGRTLVIIEHKLDQVIEWVNSVLVLAAGGRVLFSGDPAEAFYERADALAVAGVWRPQATELVQALRQAGWEVPGRPLGVAETAAALASTPGLLERLRAVERAPSGAAGPASGVAPQAAFGSETEAAPGSAPAPTPGAPLVSCRELDFRYPDGHQALRGVSVDIERDSFLAVVGENGSGKTTLTSLMSGVLSAPPGMVFLEGRDVASMPGWAISDTVGHVFQNPEHQFVTDTVYGELAYSLAPRAGRRHAGRLDARQHGLVETWLNRLGLLPLAEANPFALSQGQKRRLSVAAMLIRGQQMLILDEPTLGQDELQTERLMAMMQDLRKDGRTIIMVTHDMRLVAEQADRLLVLDRGRVAFKGRPQDFFGLPDQVAAAGLELPPVGEVGALLEKQHQVGGGLYTVAGFVDALGPRQGAGA